uniref:Ovochymase 2 n=1 Tax=Sinocyclocheilus grahami TaxID=75366 RepID=A0A672QEJ3_SINGR
MQFYIPKGTEVLDISVCKNSFYYHLVSLRIRGSHFCAAIEAVAGDFNQRKVDRGKQSFHVKTVKFHEKYQRFSPMSNDIALLEIKGHIHFVIFIKPVCLPYSGEGFPPKTMCVVGGWGLKRSVLSLEGPLPSVLQEVQLDLLEQSKCKHVLQTLRPGQNTFTVLCTGPERGGRDACQGDSGGPLLCPRADGRWVAVGVISWGKGCGRSWYNNKIKPLSRRGSAGVFTDVLMFLSWIKYNLRKRSLCSVPDGVVPGSEGIIRNPFDLENDTQCHSDHLTVYVDEDRQIGRFCGGQPPSPQHRCRICHPYSPVIKKTFHPNCALPSSTVVLLQPKGAVRRPAYPQAYSNSTLWRWLIYAPEGHIVKVKTTL